MANTRSLPWGPSLFELDDHPCPDAEFRGAQRRCLAGGAWIEHVEGWLAGAAAVFDELVGALPWQEGDQLMYGARVATPRRTWWWSQGAAAPDAPRSVPAIDGARSLLSHRYGRRLTSVGFNLYRDGADSVAWHGDRVARDHTDAVIAIVSVGARRPFKLRPKGGGASLAFELGAGDLLVMGGSCQRTWQHAVPKVARAAPRISITFRHSF